MIWEDLTVREFEEAIQKSCKTCIFPIGCLEKHGDHLPLGTDILVAREIAMRAVEQEPAVIFPYYPFGQVSEVRHKLGTIALSLPMLTTLMEAVCEEIARNGFTKIILANGHGGNNSFLRYFAQSMLDKPRSYSIYVYDLWPLTAEQNALIVNKHGPEDGGGHADTTETSDVMAINPTLVHMECVNAQESQSLNRMKKYGDLNIFTGIGWYGDYPHQFAGDPTCSTAQRGKDLLDYNVRNFVEVLKLIKNDDLVPQLQKEFYDKSQAPTV